MQTRKLIILIAVVGMAILLLIGGVVLLLRYVSSMPKSSAAEQLRPPYAIEEVVPGEVLVLVTKPNQEYPTRQQGFNEGLRKIGQTYKILEITSINNQTPSDGTSPTSALTLLVEPRQP